MAVPDPILPTGFDGFVETEIQPLFAAMQQARAEGRSWLWKYGALGAVIGLGIGGWLYISQPKIWPVSAILIVVFALLGMIPGMLRISNAKESFGKAHVGKVSGLLGLDFTTEGFEPPRFDQFNQLDLVPLGDRRKFSNLIEGSHQGVGFSIYEAFVEERRTRTTTDGDGKTRTETYWATIFHGQLLHTPYPRKFACTTVIARDWGWFNSKGRFGKKMKPMGLADPKFEKLFEVYTTDQVEGRFLVDPAFMVRLLELEDNHKARKPTAAFFEQGVFISLHGGTDFFGKLNKKSTAKSLAAETMSAFQHIFHFLEMIKGKK